MLEKEKGVKKMLGVRCLGEGKYIGFLFGLGLDRLL
jgi:hypothetical protein